MTELTVRSVDALAPLTADQVVAQVQLIQQIMSRAMKDGEHYGVIPGTSGKPSLLKAGAEKLGMVFRLRPKFQVEVTDLGGGHRGGGHREYRFVCDVFAPDGSHQGQGVGSCTTMETKYRYRKAEQTCPQCGKPAIIKGKREFGGGWLCFGKKGGCGAKFQDGDPQIENQAMGRVEHDNPADYWNTCEKMGKKRAFVDAILTATAASDIFTQDVEDMAANGSLGSQPEERPTSPAEAPASKPRQRRPPQEAGGGTPYADFLAAAEALKRKVPESIYYGKLREIGGENCKHANQIPPKDEDKQVAFIASLETAAENNKDEGLDFPPEGLFGQEKAA